MFPQQYALTTAVLAHAFLTRCCCHELLCARFVRVSRAFRRRPQHSAVQTQGMGGGKKGHATCMELVYMIYFSDDFPKYIIRRAGIYTVRLVLLIVGVLRDEISIPRCTAVQLAADIVGQSAISPPWKGKLCGHTSAAFLMCCNQRINEGPAENPRSYLPACLPSRTPTKRK